MERVQKRTRANMACIGGGFGRGAIGGGGSWRRRRNGSWLPDEIVKFEQSQDMKVMCRVTKLYSFNHSSHPLLMLDTKKTIDFFSNSPLGLTDRRITGDSMDVVFFPASPS